MGESIFEGCVSLKYVNVILCDNGERYGLPLYERSGEYIRSRGKDGEIKLEKAKTISFVAMIFT